MQAFFVVFMYAGLPYEAVEQTRKPPSRMTAGKAIFQWDMMPPPGKTAIASPCMYLQTQQQVWRNIHHPDGGIPPEIAACWANSPKPLDIIQVRTLNG